jgi:hypothetical protein
MSFICKECGEEKEDDEESEYHHICTDCEDDFVTTLLVLDII